MSLFTPINQKRLTNVAVVKLLVKVNKKRYKFEIACYPNKVYAWRQKLESNINEVLQYELVYTNVSKAEIASKDSMMEAFQTADIKKVCEIILQKGELHLTEKERQSLQENLSKDVAKIVASKTINPVSKTCFSPNVIEKMIRDFHINLKINKSAKQQSLDVIRVLKVKSRIPIDVAMISAVIKIPKSQQKQMKNSILLYSDSIVKEEESEIVAVFEPGKFDEFKTDFAHNCSIETSEILDTSNKSKQDQEHEDDRVSSASVDTTSTSSKTNEFQKTSRHGDGCEADLSASVEVYEKQKQQNKKAKGRNKKKAAMKRDEYEKSDSDANLDMTMLNQKTRSKSFCNKQATNLEADNDDIDDDDNSQKQDADDNDSENEDDIKSKHKKRGKNHRRAKKENEEEDEETSRQSQLKEMEIVKNKEKEEDDDDYEDNKRSKKNKRKNRK